MFRNKSASVHQFAMVPKAEIPRSRFNMQHCHKTTFDAGFLIPVYAEEVLPGDTLSLDMTAFARLATPLFPLMDNLHLESFFFFVPNRLVWDNWQKFMGEQSNPGDSTDFLVPQVTSPVGGFASGSMGDHFGCPTAGQLDPAATVSVNALYFRAYNLIFNEWFRDENLQDSVLVNRSSDGPDVSTDYVIRRRGKRHDYFTSCLPWPQKGDSVTLPLGDWAPVYSDSAHGGAGYPTFTTPNGVTNFRGYATDDTVRLGVDLTADVSNLPWSNPGLYTDLSQATAATINQLRQAFQIQKLLERDARGGTRYIELLRAHFGVQSPDARLQRPEYLGGGYTPVNISPIAQTSGTGTYTDTPQGNLSAMGTALMRNNGFSQSFVEHGMVIGLVCVRADLTYQQGLHRRWSRRTRYDYYFPAFAMLGEQAVLQKEIYCKGTAQDETVFGYQERWAEYRYGQSLITGQFRSTYAEPLDAWHLAQHFTTAPVLNNPFIQETPPMDRVLAIGSAANGQHFLFDSLFQVKATRPMPMYSVPGLIDHF